MDTHSQHSAQQIPGQYRTPNLYNASLAMRPTQMRPESRDSNSSARIQASGPATTRIFNCIVDDTSLVHGAKKSTRDGIRKWIAGGNIRLFVPLYSLCTPIDIVTYDMERRLEETDRVVALSHTSKTKGGRSRLASGAAEALSWLDEATTNSPLLVKLQEPYEQFETWAEVERFALPSTLLSEGNAIESYDVGHNVEGSEETGIKVEEEKQEWPSFSSADSHSGPSTPHSAVTNRSVSPLSPPTSPLKAPLTEASSQTEHGSSVDGTVKEERLASSGSQGETTTPSELRPIFNYVMWRIHQETDPRAALETFIFLTDDPVKRRCAQRFGIRVKNLEEIRHAVAREAREARNRIIFEEKEAAKNAAIKQAVSPKPTAATPVARSPKSAQVQQPAATPLSDDDEEDEVVFKRGPPKEPASMRAPQPPQSEKKLIDPNQFSRGADPAVRGNGRGSTRGGFVRGGAPRGAFVHARGGRNNAPADSPDKPIDPNSFARPSPGRGRARGGGKLWMPT